VTVPTGERVGVRSRRGIALGIVLVVAGLLALCWSAALAVFLLTTCDNKFGLGTAPALRCLQPMGWGLTGLVLCLAGVGSAVAGLVFKWMRAPG